MDRNAYRDENDTDRPGSYWRRRVITLAAGICLLGLMAWAFSGGGGKQGSPAARTSQASAVVPAVAYSSGPPPSNGVTGSASPGSVTGRSSASGPQSLSPTSSLGSQPSAAGQPTTPASASGQAGASPPAAGVAPAGSVAQRGGCSPAAVVLSLFASRPDYYGGQDPDFEVYVVSTASGACAFGTSPEKLHVVVMSSGRIIWDSADCARGQANRVAELRRGVPAHESVSWNRTISLPGCVTAAAAARPGTYQVQARTGTVASPIRTFRLARLLRTAI